MTNPTTRTIRHLEPVALDGGYVAVPRWSDTLARWRWDLRLDTPKGVKLGSANTLDKIREAAERHRAGPPRR